MRRNPANAGQGKGERNFGLCDSPSLARHSLIVIRIHAGEPLKPCLFSFDIHALPEPAILSATCHTRMEGP